MLGRFGRDAGVLLSFRPEVTQGLDSAGLRGSFTVQTGLERLLAGTGIEVRPQGAGGYVLERHGGVAQLQAITVAAQASSDGLPAPYAGGQVARGGSLGMLGSADVMDVPFNTTNYTAQTLENQQARTLADVVVNEASVRTLTSSGGFGEDFQIRGYTVSSGDVGLNGLFGLTSSSRMPAAIMERVEVLKGPGTLMNGVGPNGSIGGGINVVTKRAGDEPLTRLTATYQDKSQLGGMLDMGRRFGDNEEWGIRVNGVYHNGQTTLDGGSQRQGMGALALDYRGERLRWSLDAYTQRERTDNFRPQVGFQSSVTELPSPPSGHRNFYPGTQLKLEDSTVASRLEYDINDAVTVYAAGGYRYGTADQTFPPGPVDANGDFTARNAFYDSYSRTSTGEAGLRARFDTWGVKHNLALGATRLDQELGNFYLTSTATTPSNIYNPSPCLMSPDIGARPTRRRKPRSPASRWPIRCRLPTTA
ncbi:tonB-dependent Receptor Plug domain protein [Bordetella holmesii 41130]|nr:tonB-dependent Receptor Plug domain protein [Bordetella holmesii 41130]